LGPWYFSPVLDGTELWFKATRCPPFGENPTVLPVHIGLFAIASAADKTNKKSS
jgi:hypothetical protein